ncbi:hypothetical protein AB4254_09025 [Vibrio breoganii]
MRERFIELGNELSDASADDAGKLKEFLSLIKVGSRAPRGCKAQKEKLDFLIGINDVFDKYAMFGSDNVKAVFSYWGENDLSSIYDKFAPDAQKDQKREFSTRRLTVKNDSSLSEAQFASKAKDLCQFAASLSGVHGKLLEKNKVVVVFKNKGALKSRGKFKSDTNELWLRRDIATDNDLYGHGKFILAHEMGHLNEAVNGLPEGFYAGSMYTTTYSYHEGLSGSEAYAELFAMVLWPERYQQYSSKISRFERMLSNQFRDLSPESEKEIG